jgi:enolase-phosphatase E1
VTIALGSLGVGAVVLDIEGTTTPISFVYDVLFPYARTNLREFLETHGPTGLLAEVDRQLREEHAADVARGDAPPPLPADVSSGNATDLEPYALWLMDRDRKSPGLKLLQGLIWQRGFSDGTLRGEVFPDVAPALQRWRDESIDVAIYSSGSVLAQRLIFGHTPDGDDRPETLGRQLPPHRVGAAPLAGRAALPVGRARGALGGAGGGLQGPALRASRQRRAAARG